MKRLLYPMVFFDVDSTLVSIEGIDELAHGIPGVAELTRGAMEGRIPLEDVYARRLELVRPSRAALERLAEQYQSSLVDGAREVIDALREAGAEIHLVTAGLEQAILPLARSLNIEARRVHAVRIEHDAAGEYTGFDSRSPLTRTGGKELVILDVRARSKRRAALVGDGASDAEAARAVNLFVGFGGIAAREAVRKVAAVYIEEPSLMPLMQILFAEEQ